MKLFELHRFEDESGVSGRGVVAQGVQFDDGTCAMRWTTENRSTALYDDVATLEKIHGHNGKSAVVFTSEMFDRARTDAMQDRCENVPFASVGGLDKRDCMTTPSYIDLRDATEYMRGYRSAAYMIYGADWQTCSFGWAPALSIPAGAL